MAQFYIFRSVDDPAQPGTHLEVGREIIRGNSDL